MRVPRPESGSFIVSEPYQTSGTSYLREPKGESGLTSMERSFQEERIMSRVVRRGDKVSETSAVLIVLGVVVFVLLLVGLIPRRHTPIRPPRRGGYTPKEEYRHFDQYCPICMRDTIHRQGMAVSDKFYWCTECKVAFGMMEEIAS